jgi:hypothetical protein
MSHIVFRPGNPGFFCLHCEGAADLTGDSVRLPDDELSAQLLAFQQAHGECEPSTPRERALRAELFLLRMRVPTAEARNRRFREALERVVGVGFDNPASALMSSVAKDALAFECSGPCEHGRDPWDRCDECADLGQTEAWVRATKWVAP